MNWKSLLCTIVLGLAGSAPLPNGFRCSCRHDVGEMIGAATVFCEVKVAWVCAGPQGNGS